MDEQDFDEKKKDTAEKKTKEKKESRDYVFDFGETDRRENGASANGDDVQKSAQSAENGKAPGGLPGAYGPYGGYEGYGANGGAYPKNGGNITPDPFVYEQRRKMFEKDAPQKKKPKAGKIVACCAAAVLVAGMGFFGGYYTYQGMLDKEMRSLIWAKDRIQNDYYEKITDEEFYDALFGTINGMLDPYSGYLTAEQYADVQEEAKGKWSGLGVTFSTKDASGQPQLLVSRVLGNSPAEAAGIEPGMYIVGFGLSREDVTETQSYEEMSEFLQARAANEPFFLKLKAGKNGEPFLIEIAKKTFVENYVFYRSDDSAYIFTGKDALDRTESDNVLSALDEETAYIRLTQFNGNAAAEFTDAMDIFKAEGKKNLILDLRANGGGYLHILQDIASYFCKEAQGKTPVAAIADYPKKGEYVYRATANRYYDYFSADSRISVLADNGTASASECLLGCMIDYRAVDYDDIYLSSRNGEAKTYGKGIMQSTFASSPFGKPDAIKLTTAKILWPVTKNCIHGRGILPADGAHTVQENYSGDAEILEAWASISQRK